MPVEWNLVIASKLGQLNRPMACPIAISPSIAFDSDVLTPRPIKQKTIILKLMMGRVIWLTVKPQIGLALGCWKTTFNYYAHVKKLYAERCQKIIFQPAETWANRFSNWVEWRLRSTWLGYAKKIFKYIETVKCHSKSEQTVIYFLGSYLDNLGLRDDCAMVGVRNSLAHVAGLQAGASGDPHHCNWHWREGWNKTKSWSIVSSSWTTLALLTLNKLAFFVLRTKT